jgi:hypothetical protein
MDEKLDFLKARKDLYAPPKDPVAVTVPPMRYLMLDGSGNPNTSPFYQAVVEALFSMAYTIKFAIKKSSGTDYGVLPLEGLWWADDPQSFLNQEKDLWSWTMMIAQPDLVKEEVVEKARAKAKKKKGLPLLDQVRFEAYDEGLCAQMMHIGPYSAEGPNIARMHAFIEQQGCRISGKHHEIYLSDVRRTAPEKLRTILRQPME